MPGIADWKQLIISPGATVGEANAMLDAAPVELLIVADENEIFHGVVSERIIRRAMLNGAREDYPILSLVEGGCVFAQDAEKAEVYIDAPQAVIYLQQWKVVGVDVPEHVPARNNLVVLMVGGAGTRLRPLTNSCPKPLLPVQGRPLLELTIERLRSLGYANLCMTVGYRADMIVDHFGDGSRWQTKIKYVYERERMGTCGALRLLPERPTSPLIVMNGDLITGINFDKLLSHHEQTGAPVTMCAHRHDVQIPYGVLTSAGDQLKSFTEKPVSSSWINAGIYVLNPSVIDLIPPGQPFDMPALLQLLQDAGNPISIYALRERWIDIGSLDEYERANNTPGILPPTLEAQIPYVNIGDAPAFADKAEAAEQRW